MRKIILILLSTLIATNAFAGGFKVNKKEKFQPRPGWTEKVDKRTSHGKVYQLAPDDTTKFVAIVGVEPMHYQDESGNWQEYDLASKDTIGEFTQVIHSGKYDIRYSPQGRVRYERNKGYIEFVPNFDTTNVTIEFNINHNGLKANYILDDYSAPNRLAWFYDYNTLHEKDNNGKGKGRVKNIQDQTVAELGSFTAFDAAGATVDLSVNYVGDSLIVDVDTVGMVFPITVDPSIGIDSIVPIKSQEIASAAGTPTASRQAADGTSIGGIFTSDNPTTGFASNQLFRLMLSFPLGGFAPATSVDSTKIGFTTYFISAAPRAIYPISGTFSGDPAVGWFNDFQGWVADAAHDTSGAMMTTEPWRFATDTDSTGPTPRYRNFTSAYNDSVLNTINASDDTLRVALLDSLDVFYFPTATDSRIGFGGGAARPDYPVPIIEVYYDVGVISPPGISTVSDTLYASAKFVGRIDSTGGENLTSRGVDYWLQGSVNDTIRISESGSFSTGTFVVETDTTLLTDVYYLYRSWGTNSTATSYGAIDSISTTLTGGGSIYIDGRLINSVR